MRNSSRRTGQEHKHRTVNSPLALVLRLLSRTASNRKRIAGAASGPGLAFVAVLVMLTGWVIFAWPHNPLRAAPVSQAFDAGATVTALVATRDTIHALLTLTASQSGGTPGPAPGLNAQTTVSPSATRLTLPSATIRAAALNVRVGPGTSYAAVATVATGETYTILRQAANCSWLLIGQGKQEIGWVSGNTQYVSYTVACATLPVFTGN